MQFMKICTVKPDMLPPLDAIGLDPADQCHGMGRGGAPGRRPTGATPPLSSRNSQTGLGINPPAGFGAKPGPGSGFNMENFQTQQKLYSEERFVNSTRNPSTSGVPPNMQRFPGSPMARTASQGGPGSISGSGRTRSLRGQKKGYDQTNTGPSGYQQQAHGLSFGPSGPLQIYAGSDMEAILPLTRSSNAWVPASVRRTQPVEQESSEIVDRKVRGLLNRLTVERFDSISEQIINKSEEEQDGKTLRQVIGLILEHTTDDSRWSEMYARLCRKMMEQISPRVEDVDVKNAEGKLIAGGQLVRKYLLNRCREDFERGWIDKEVTAATTASQAIWDQTAQAAQGKAAKRGGEEEVVLYSNEYYAQKAKRRRRGLINFIGELFKLQMLTERIMHECVKKLLVKVQNPEEEKIESLCELLSMVGKLLDTGKGRLYMDIYFKRIKELCKNPKVSVRTQFKLQVRLFPPIPPNHLNLIGPLGRY
jgi:translation initiation factor 4G